ncbi:MAG TPA: DNA mismatch repair protein MutS [Chitinophagaceae bacterium]|nr:DNA mismatch repair protein MutS [Chitinophagaceae bacterium]
MQIDKTTYSDLSVFQTTDDYSLFSKLDQTRTVGGRIQLLEFFNHPFSQTDKIRETQAILQIIRTYEHEWGPSISNGTIMVMERFYDTPLDQLPASHDPVSARIYKLLHTSDYALTRYSITHFADFIRGMFSIAAIGGKTSCPPLLKNLMDRVIKLLGPDTLHAMIKKKPGEKLVPGEVVEYGNFIRNHFKNSALTLIEIYGMFDAWYSMAMAGKEFNLVMPEFLDTEYPFIEVKALHHLLLPHAVSYDVHMDPDTNFFFLTGANMAGKSTFIRSVGTALFLAHLGMGVPADSMKTSIFDGILSNINVVDNLVKGESYFFNEVQRIRNTIIQISDKKKWLVLIDELFKGTNVQDAMKCSSTVIRGLIKIRSSLFILSTHLYEIGEELRFYPNICFKYFETRIQGGQLEFPYQLKDGISNDRLGYLILEREKVVELLEKL